MPYIMKPADIHPILAEIGIPFFFMDGFSWSFAISVITLAFVVYLTLVIESTRMDWLSLIMGLLMTAFCLLSIQTREIAAILVSWAVIDIGEFLLLLFRIKEKERVAGIIKSFSFRIVSVVLFLWGTSDASVLIIAAAIRVVVVPIGKFTLDELTMPKSMVHFMSIISPVSAFIAFSQIALIKGEELINPTLYIIILAIGVSASYLWYHAADAFEGRRYWIITTGSFLMLSSLRGLPLASISWGITLVLGGGLLFYSDTNGGKPLFPFIGLLAITSIPFMPTWDGASLYTAALNYSTVVLVFAQSLLVAGYFKHIKKSKSSTAPERWVQLINPGRMVLIISIYWLIAFLLWRDGILLNNSTPLLLGKQIIDYYIGFVIVFISLLLFLFARSQNRALQRIRSIKITPISFDWVKKIDYMIFQFIDSIMQGFSVLVEGESGILLTLLLLALVITFFIQGTQ